MRGGFGWFYRSQPCRIEGNQVIFQIFGEFIKKLKNGIDIIEIMVYYLDYISGWIQKM